MPRARHDSSTRGLTNGLRYLDGRAARSFPHATRGSKSQRLDEELGNRIGISTCAH